MVAHRCLLPIACKTNCYAQKSFKILEDVEDIEDLDDVEDPETFADVQTTIQRWHTFMITSHNSLVKVTLGLSFALHLQSGGQCKLQSCIAIVIRRVPFC